MPVLDQARERHVGSSRRRRRGRGLVMVLCALVLAASAVVLVAPGGSPPVPPAGFVRLTAGGETVYSERADVLRRLSQRSLERRLRPLRSRTVRRGRTKALLRTDQRALVTAVERATRAGGGTVPVPEHAVAASTRLPVVRQALRNNCETAALSMLLAARGVEAPQLKLQRAVRRNGPKDPSLDASGDPAVWGDPTKGYVGRAEGGGTSGGYGVYERPVSALARRRGVKLADLTGSSPERVYRRLLSGRPVMVWVGLSAGPYKTWRTPEGRSITGNFGEHTVVLTGTRRGLVELNDPLVGRRATWTRKRFELLWKRLGRRALSV